MGHQDLEVWLSKNRRRFHKPSMRLCWHAIFDGYCANGGRMSGEFRSAVQGCGYDVRPVARGGFELWKVGPWVTAIGTTSGARAHRLPLLPQ